ncbi:transcriptional regulator GcvA [Bradyrhizobium sp. LHD-71]|uniref:transcriptional regulator GcvA n=1 Tax=Bradyrhizobium sp. LHD-71 TaxID=3072141 RepID=UPI00280F1209|nr:transcriptional regulator GcvA [Bradyrhizobium sp. LHD-71]MDQ8728217.1 transcriptional regulator GcvA [Bradyrhizobium sp. LHD-71]
MPPLNHLRAFEAAARHESFTKAADELNVTQGAVSRHIRTLEDYLGFELFDRGTSGVHLSDASRQFAGVLTRAFDNIDKATETLAKDRRRTILEIRGYTNFLVRWLLPRLPDFQSSHPHIEIKLSSGREELEFGKDGPDVAIRYGHGQWDGLHADLLFEDELLPNCSPALAESVPLQKPEDLLKATVYHSHLRRQEWPRWFGLVSKEPFMPAQEVYTEDLAVAHQCVLAGMGIGLGQREYIADDIANGRLIVPFNIPLKRKAGFYCVYPESRKNLPKVTAFRDWLLSRRTPAVKPQIVSIAQQRRLVA